MDIGWNESSGEDDSTSKAAFSAMDAFATVPRLKSQMDLDITEAAHVQEHWITVQGFIISDDCSMWMQSKQREMPSGSGGVEVDLGGNPFVGDHSSFAGCSFNMHTFPPRFSLFVSTDWPSVGGGWSTLACQRWCCVEDALNCVLSCLAFSGTSGSCRCRGQARREGRKGNRINSSSLQQSRLSRSLTTSLLFAVFN